LVIAVVAVSLAGTLLPYTPLGVPLGFTPLPLSLLGAIALLTLTYMMLVQAVKTWFYRRHALL
jgi:Mg2+-importing ATPase